MRKWLLYGCLITVCSFTVHAQVPDFREGQLADIKMLDGSRLIGVMEHIGSDTVELYTAYFGLLKILQSEISSVRYLSDPKPYAGTFLLPNPNASRHFFSPTAIPLSKNEGYYQNFYIAFNMVNWGFTDNLSFGVAAVPFIWFIESDLLNLAVTGKYGYALAPDWHISAGFIAGGILDIGYGGIGFGLVTYGSSDNNITFGGGYASFVTDPGSEYQDNEKSAVYNLAGMYRVGEHFALVTENWYFSHPDLLLLSYGGRYMGDKISVDVGFINNADILSEIPIGIPLLGVVIYL